MSNNHTQTGTVSSVCKNSSLLYIPEQTFYCIFLFFNKKIIMNKTISENGKKLWSMKTRQFKCFAIHTCFTVIKYCRTHGSLQCSENLHPYANILENHNITKNGMRSKTRGISSPPGLYSASL